MYASPDDGPDWEDINADRYNVLKDQLQLYRSDKISWTIWLYKDIGFQGMVYVIFYTSISLLASVICNRKTEPFLPSYAGDDTPYRKRFREFHLKKKRLAADEWGADPSTVANVFVPVEEWIMKEVRILHACICEHILTDFNLRRLILRNGTRQCGPPPTSW